MAMLSRGLEIYLWYIVTVLAVGSVVIIAVWAALAIRGDRRPRGVQGTSDGGGSSTEQEAA